MEPASASKRARWELFKGLVVRYAASFDAVSEEFVRCQLQFHGPIRCLESTEQGCSCLLAQVPHQGCSAGMVWHRCLTSGDTALLQWPGTGASPGVLCCNCLLLPACRLQSSTHTSAPSMCHRHSAK